MQQLRRVVRGVAERRLARHDRHKGSAPSALGRRALSGSVLSEALLRTANGFLELREALAGRVAVQANVEREALAVVVDLRLDLREPA